MTLFPSNSHAFSPYSEWIGLGENLYPCFSDGIWGFPVWFFPVNQSIDIPLAFLERFRNEYLYSAAISACEKSALRWWVRNDG